MDVCSQNSTVHLIWSPENLCQWLGSSVEWSQNPQACDGNVHTSRCLRRPPCPSLDQSAFGIRPRSDPWEVRVWAAGVWKTRRPHSLGSEQVGSGGWWVRTWERFFGRRSTRFIRRSSVHQNPTAGYQRRGEEGDIHEIIQQTF